MRILRRGGVAVVVNPAAGAGRGAAVGRELIGALRDAGHDVDDLSAVSIEGAQENARAAVDHGARALVVVGGDGLVHVGLQVTADTAIPLGIVPVGTGNDFASAVGIPVESRPAIRRVVAGLGSAEPSPVDLLLVEGDGVDAPCWVGGAVSAGLDAAVNARANAMRRPRGSARYVIAALRELAGYRAWEYALVARHVPLDDDAREHLLRFSGVSSVEVETSGDGYRVEWATAGALMTFANGATLGGGIPIAPDASTTDGFGDVVLAGDVGRAGAFPLFARMLRGHHARSSRLRLFRARSIELSPGPDAQRLPEVYGDGELLGSLPLRATLVPGALRLLG